MKESSVLAVIVVLMCCCLSFGNGDEGIENARETLHKRYGQFLTFLKNPDVLPAASTIRRHLREVEDKEKKCRNWIKRISGYSHEHLSNPPGFFLNENELKLATEYHLWRAGWYLVRSRTLSKAAEHAKNLDDEYTSTYKCRAFASEAYERSNDHKKKYLQCYKALSEPAKKNLMVEIKFPSYMAFQKLDHGSDVILIVKTQLEHLIYRLLRRKAGMNSKDAKGSRFIQKMLTPSRNKLNEDIMSKLTTCFSVEDLSKPPNESSRSDRPFLEVAMLFNQYRSLWHEIRYNHFLNFIQRGKQGRTSVDLERVEKTIAFETSAFKRYALLSHNYHKMCKMHQPDKITIVEDTLPASDFIEAGQQSHICESEPIQWGGKRRRTTREPVEHQTLNENVQSVFDEMDHSEIVATKLDGPTKEKGAHRAKRYKFLKEVYIQTGPHLEEPRKSSNGQSDSDLSTAGLDNENPIDPVLRTRLSQPETGLVVENMAMDRPAETCFQNNHMARKRPELDLNVPQLETTILQNALERPKLDLNFSPLETEKGLSLVEEHQELHSSLVPSASRNNQHLNDAIKMDSIAPEQSKFTPSEENHSQHCSNLHGVQQSSREACSKANEDLYSTFKYEFYNVL